MLELPQRLRERRPEIEEAVLARVRSVENPSAVEDPEYARGIKEAVQATLKHAICVLESGETASQPIPAQLIAQARCEARNAVGLDTVLRRYLACHGLLCDFAFQEAADSPAEMRRALRALTAQLERVLAEVTDAYRLEVEARHRSTEHRRREQVGRLLAGEPQDSAELRYELELWHLGVVAAGSEAKKLLGGIATALDRRLLAVPAGGGEVWAWLGGNRRLAPQELAECVHVEPHAELALAIGEPGRGVSGWRLTHRQARAALPVALRGGSRIVNYSDVALLAAALGDEVLIRSLTELYLVPLAAERDGGAALRETLCAYFAAGRSVSSAAAAVGVSRQTVNARLHAAERKIGRPLDGYGPDIETALRLWGLGDPTHTLHP